MITAGIIVYLIISLPFVISNMRDSYGWLGDFYPAMPFRKAVVQGVATPLILVLGVSLLGALFVGVIYAFVGLCYGLYWIATNLP